MVVPETLEPQDERDEGVPGYPKSVAENECDKSSEVPKNKALPSSGISSGIEGVPLLPDDSATTDDEDFSKGDATTKFDGDWRLEVHDRGRFYTWRRGSGKNRQGSYGGMFRKLNEEQVANYERNRDIRAKRIKGAAKRKKQKIAALKGDGA